MTQLTKAIKKLNPERNDWVKAALYFVGTGGTLHLTTLLVIAIKNRRITDFNALFAVDLEKVFPVIQHNYWSFVGGWLFVALCVYTIHRVLNKHNTPPHQ